MINQNFVGQFNLQPKSKNLITEGGLRTRGIFKKDAPDSVLVSVITVVRNAADTIQRCINSVKEQTYPNVEHILIDGASNDGTVKIISSNEQFLDYFISEPDSGIYEAMNKGLRLAQGRHILMLNADDWLISDGIRKLNEKILEDNAHFAIGNANFVDEDGHHF